MDQLFLGQCESGRHDRLGEEGVESGVDLIAQIEHAVLDGHRLFGEEEMETGVLPQGGDRLWGDAGRVGFALLEDLGDQVGQSFFSVWNEGEGREEQTNTEVNVPTDSHGDNTFHVSSWLFLSYAFHFFCQLYFGV